MQQKTEDIVKDVPVQPANRTSGEVLSDKARSDAGPGMVVDDHYLCTGPDYQHKDFDTYTKPFKNIFFAALDLAAVLSIYLFTVTLWIVGLYHLGNTFPTSYLDLPLIARISTGIGSVVLYLYMWYHILQWPSPSQILGHRYNDNEDHEDLCLECGTLFSGDSRER